MRANAPSMRQLMDDPVYRAYMKQRPPAHHANTHGNPWQLWLNRGDGRWATVQCATYDEVWKGFVTHFRADTGDPTITARRVFYAPPGEWYRVKVKRPRRPTPENKATTKIVVEVRWRQLFFWDSAFSWCGRCRRPTLWQQLPETHHALRKLPAVSHSANTYENLRCNICGIRQVAQPGIDQMTRPAVNV